MLSKFKLLINKQLCASLSGAKAGAMLPFKKKLNPQNGTMSIQVYKTKTPLKMVEIDIKKLKIH
jgi:hypothetical protein